MSGENVILVEAEFCNMEELLKKLRDKTITREELIKLKNILERRIKELEEKGECEKAQAEAVILAMVENLLGKY